MLAPRHEIPTTMRIAIDGPAGADDQGIRGIDVMIKPMLAVDLKGQIGDVPRDGNWIIDPKLDGCRWISRVESGSRSSSGDGNGIEHWIGRTGSRTTASYEIDQALRYLPRGTVLDGELVSEGRWGVLADGAPKKLYLFDLLVDTGTDVMGRSWEARRARLELMCRELPVGAPVTLLPCLRDPERFEAAHAEWLDAGLEGSVAKRRDSIYSPGSRSKNRWLKISSTVPPASP